MIFITGPLYSGKTDYAKSLCDESGIISNVEELAFDCGDLPALADRLAGEYEVVISTEIGGGIVPVDADDRLKREKAGRLSCLLALRADTVIRVFCGIPMALKGELPC